MIIFEIPGLPIPQKQTQFARGRAYNPSSKDRERIRWQAKPFAPPQPLSGPIWMTLEFYLPIPESYPQKERNRIINNSWRHIKRPDVDNLAYLVTNALKEMFYVDDSQIWRLNLLKCYGLKPCTIVQIVEIPDGETKCA